jgi:hypothetical protein
VSRRSSEHAHAPPLRLAPHYHRARRGIAGLFSSDVFLRACSSRRRVELRRAISMILDKRCATVMYYYALFSLHGPGGYGTSSHETLTGYGGDLWRGPSEKIDRVQMVMVMCTYTVREV